MTDSATAASDGIARAFYAACLSGDLDGILATLHPDIRVYEPSFLPYGGLTTGRQAFVDLFGEIVRHIDPASVKLDRIVPGDDVFVGFLEARTQRGEALVIAEKASIRDGRIAELRIFYHEGGDLFPRAVRP